MQVVFRCPEIKPIHSASVLPMLLNLMAVAWHQCLEAP